jgi:signal transduction histidine kinase
MDAAQSHSQNGSHGELLTLVVHDIRNYLQSILGGMEALLEEAIGRDPSERTELLRRIHRNVLSAHVLVANYLDVARIDGGLYSVIKQPVQLDNLLEQVEHLYKTEAQRKQVTLERQPQEQLPIILGDSGALARVFSNLVHNALKFTPARGRITLSAARHDGKIAISVADTGCGIAPADLSMIFAKGWCAAANGSSGSTGLGLFIVKTLVEAHAGRIAVESTLGQGSCFTVFLPCELS